MRGTIRRGLDGQVVFHFVSVTGNVNVITARGEILQGHRLDVLVTSARPEHMSLGIGHFQVKTGQARLLGQHLDTLRPDHLEAIPIDVRGAA